MKSNKNTVSSIFLIIIVIGCNKQYTITENDKFLILQAAEEYYSALEEKDFKKALDMLYPQKGKIQMFETSNRCKALKELTKHLDYKVKLLSLGGEVKENTTSFINGKADKGLYTVSAKVDVGYKDNNNTEIIEMLYFKKQNDVWLLQIIESCDRYVILRSNQYCYTDAF
jgi:hypothetical protein